MANPTRRTFLKTSAAATAAVLSTRAFGANDRIRVALIGCRNQGPNDAREILTDRNAELTVLCDCDDAMLEIGWKRLERAWEHAPDREADFRQVLDRRDVDAVVIATPDHWHAAMTAMALDAGKHVYIEKPASFNIADGRRMVTAQERHSDLVVQVGTQQRSGKHFHEAKAFVDEGNLGKPAFARAWISHTREPVPKIPDSQPPPSLDYDMWVGPAPLRPYNANLVHYNWRWSRDWGTGEMGNWGAHWLDVARWFLNVDMPTAVSAHGGTFVTHDIKQWPDTQTALFEYPEATILWEQRLWTDYTINGRRNGVEVGGENGSLVIDRDGWVFYPRDGDPVEHAGSNLSTAHARNFLNAIRGTENVYAPMIEGHFSAAMCHLGNIATVLGDRVEFDVSTETIPNNPAAAALIDRPYREPWNDYVAT